MFNIDFDKLITWLLPPLLRQRIFCTWMQSLCAGVPVLYGTPMAKTAGTFMGQRYLDLYQANHNSQVFSMENVFNDAFDNVSRRIVITDGLGLQRIYLYTREEGHQYTVFLNPQIYLWNNTDYSDTGVDFIVWVPPAITMSATQLINLASLVNRYKLASKRYVIYQANPPA